jgi:plastocyanin
MGYASGPPVEGVQVGKVAFALAVVLALGAAGCGASGPSADGDCVDLTAGPTARIGIADFGYAPPCFTVRLAQGIALTNHDAADHTFTIRGTGVDAVVEGSASRNLDPLGAEADPGTYDLICRYHPGMVGTITLR